ncbi:hypothetical protein [Paenisporosarcina sp. OV554]|uniref:hypothetical protein n=1 Tax=Paenisporosarcina sp. OV554 TaxID=2135694 RepID=UPI000D3C4846|nr:hypothetical protein [Paenisporosarcina sp. OV554]
MEVILTSIFTILITIMTFYNLIKVFTLAYKKKQITYSRLLLYVTSSIAVGFVVASILPLVIITIVEVLI